VECGDYRRDQGKSPAHPRLRSSNPLILVPFDYYAEHSERETQLCVNPTNADKTFKPPGAGRGTG
jgi:hypothetical protein